MHECPYSGGRRREEGKSEKPNTLGAHRAALVVTGLQGLTSRMAFESVFSVESGNPRLPIIHAEEGSKFAKLAFRLLPPVFAAEFISQVSVLYPPVAQLDAPSVGDAFFGLLQGLAPRARDPRATTPLNYEYPRDLVRDYLEHSSRDPRLFLACFSLSVGLCAFAEGFAEGIPPGDLHDHVIGVGRQFNASNLMRPLPVALFATLRGPQGGDPKNVLLDSDICRTAIHKIEANGQFSLRGRLRAGSGPGTPRQIELRCPMQGYLKALLLDHEGLKPISAGIERVGEDLKAGHSRAPENAEAAEVLELYRANTELAKAAASQALRSMDS